VWFLLRVLSLKELPDFGLSFRLRFGLGLRFPTNHRRLRDRRGEGGGLGGQQRGELPRSNTTNVESSGLAPGGRSLVTLEASGPSWAPHFCTPTYSQGCGGRVCCGPRTPLARGTPCECRCGGRCGRTSKEERSARCTSCTARTTHSCFWRCRAPRSGLHFLP